MKFLFRQMPWPDSTNRRIFRAAVIIGLLTLLAKAAIAVKEVFVARWFGRDDSLDALLIAYLVPYFVMSLAMGALVSAFVPTFVETREKQGIDAAQRLFSSAMFLSVIVVIPVTILLAVLAPYYLPYMGSSFSAAKLRLTRELLYMMLPVVLFGGVAVFVSAVLNAGEKFALPALAPLVTPIVTILFLEAAVKSWGAFSLAGGIVTGSILEAALLTRALNAQGIRFTLKWRGMDSSMRSVLGQYAPMMAGSFLMCGTSVVDQSMAAMLPGGSVAALNYANKIVGAVVAIGSVGLSTAALPYFSKMAAQNDWNGCRHTLKRYSALVTLAAVPFTACLIVFSKPLVRLLFQRGAFSSTDTELVSRVQMCYVIQIPFYICGMLFVRFLSSIRRNDILMYGAVISLPLDIVLNLVLMRVWGVAGIALSTSLVYAVSLLYLATFSLRLLAKERLGALAALQ
jgi:putative peptidoglycan lipid II flippase